MPSELVLKRVHTFQDCNKLLRELSLIPKNSNKQNWLLQHISVQYQNAEVHIQSWQDKD